MEEHTACAAADQLFSLDLMGMTQNSVWLDTWPRHQTTVNANADLDGLLVDVNNNGLLTNHQPTWEIGMSKQGKA
ncbi:Hypothetical predicted protein [Scomber scombrus]|uniref:Uncharacterized protein n=1 Tax=Scomber scombrus TaxID=13677 RepID=A0AAV1PFB9_SCOSC